MLMLVYRAKKLTLISAPAHPLYFATVPSGVIALMHFIAFLSVNIGVLNLLPIPAFDGGRILFILIELARRKPVDFALESKIHYWGFIVLLVLMAYITLNDVMRILRLR